jgi:hypothetical protein
LEGRVSINYATIQEAIRTSVVAGTGLDDGQVVWAYNAYQGGERPAGERFVTLQLGPSTSIGIDGYSTEIDLGRPNGSEVELKATTIQKMGVYISCFGGTPIGNTSAYATLERFRNRLGLPGVRNLLLNAGLAPFDAGTVTNIPHIEGTKFESRAVLEMRCYLDVNESDYAGFIAHVHATGTVGTFINVDADLGV